MLELKRNLIDVLFYNYFVILVVVLKRLPNILIFSNLETIVAVRVLC